MTQEIIVTGIGIVVAIAIVLRTIGKIRQIQSPHRCDCSNGCTGCKHIVSEKEHINKQTSCSSKKK